MTTETMKKLTEAQLEALKANYANMLIDGMDMDTLCQFAFDTIMQNMEMWDQQDVSEEVNDLYGEEMLKDLMESVDE
jgi:hypothetical protein